MRVAVEECRRLRPPVWSLRLTLAELRHLAKEYARREWRDDGLLEPGDGRGRATDGRLRAGAEAARRDVARTHAARRGDVLRAYRGSAARLRVSRTCAHVRNATLTRWQCTCVRQRSWHVSSRSIRIPAAVAGWPHLYRPGLWSRARRRHVGGVVRIRGRECQRCFAV